MLRHFIIIVICLVLVSSTVIFGPIWSYDDESAWPGGYCKKGGKRQSPIDIRTQEVIKDYDRQFIKHGTLKFVGYESALLSGINNGHTIQFSTEGGKKMHPTVTGGPLKYLYRLEQLHFHWLSEHSIDGVKYVSALYHTIDSSALRSQAQHLYKFPMEIHFVHVRSDLKVSEALKKRDGLAILSVFCFVQPQLPDNLEVTDDLMQNIPQLLRVGDRISGVLLNLRKLLSPKTNSYYTYLGSLTSPECNEVVVWIIFDKPIYISDAQYRAFGKVGVGRHNFRSQQKLKHHLVFSPPDTFITTPRAVVIVTDVVKYVTNFFRNITRFVVRGLKSGN